MINIAVVDSQYLLFFSLATAKTITRDHCYTELKLQTGNAAFLVEKLKDTFQNTKCLFGESI